MPREPEAKAREGCTEVHGGRCRRDFRPDDIDEPVPALGRLEDRSPRLVRDVRFDGVGVMLEVGELDERARERPSVIEDVHRELLRARLSVGVDGGDDL